VLPYVLKVRGRIAAVELSNFDKLTTANVVVLPVATLLVVYHLYEE
jgi:hypothetical protein